MLVITLLPTQNNFDEHSQIDFFVYACKLIFFGFGLLVGQNKQFEDVTLRNHDGLYSLIE